MARGDLLKRLFQSYQKKDDDAFRQAAMQVIAEEQSKNHSLLANELSKILANGSINGLTLNSQNTLSSLPKDTERQAILVEVRRSNKSLADLVLPNMTVQLVREIMEEFRKSEALKTYGILPRKKILLCGPPGCGKSLLAEVFAGEMGLPLLYTRFDAVVSSYLGETSANLRKVFDYAASDMWVVLFDEFDAIGKTRDDLSEHGELKRVINSFLQLLDGFMGDSFIIAATNHEHLLDSAIWRRFDEVIRLDRPTIHDIRKLLSRKLASMPHPQLNVEQIAPRLKGLSHAEVERICYDSIRLAVLTDSREVTRQVFEKSIDRGMNRLKAIEMADTP